MGQIEGAKDYRAQQQDIAKGKSGAVKSEAHGVELDRAIEAMHRQTRSDGKPQRFNPLEERV